MPPYSWHPERGAGRKANMHEVLMRLWLTSKALLEQSDGQAMSEYALVFALVAFGCIAGQHAVATSVNQVFITLAGEAQTNLNVPTGQ